jgi:hypothetical protein
MKRLYFQCSEGRKGKENERAAKGEREKTEGGRDHDGTTGRRRGNEEEKKLDARAVDGVDVVLLRDRPPDDLVQRQRAHEPGPVEEDELVARGEGRGEGGVGLVRRRGHPPPEERRRRRLLGDPVAVWCRPVRRRRLGLLVQERDVPSPGVGVGGDVRRHGNDPREDRGQRVVDRREDLRRREHAAGPALRHEDAPRGQLPPDDGLVELAGVELEAGPAGHGVREVADDDVERAVRRSPQLRGGVVADELEPRVRERGPVGLEVLLAEVADDAVDIDHQAALHRGVPQDLARGGALAPAGDEDVSRVAVRDEGGVDKHLVVDVLVGLGGLGLAVEEEDLRCILIGRGKREKKERAREREREGERERGEREKR